MEGGLASRLRLVRDHGFPPRRFADHLWRVPASFLLRDMLPFSLRQTLNVAAAAKHVSFPPGGDTCVTRGRRFALPESTPAELILATWHEVFVPYPPNGHCYSCERCAVEAGDIVVDIGAAEGFFTQLALERGAERVICFEPSRRWCDGLRRTFRKEIASNRVVVHCASVGVAGQTAGAQPLDELVLDAGLTRPCFLKIDVEGAELDVLRSAQRFIVERKPRVAVATYHSFEEASQCLDFLSASCRCYRFEFRGLSRSLDRGDMVPQILSAWPSDVVSADHAIPNKRDHGGGN